MSDDPHNHLAESGVTVPSDSELYSAGDELSSPPSSNSPVILYKPPTVWSLVRGAAINLLLPFINGMMLGFGELFAHEAAFRLGWGGTKVSSACAVLSISVTNGSGLSSIPTKSSPHRTRHRSPRKVIQLSSFTERPCELGVRGLSGTQNNHNSRACPHSTRMMDECIGILRNLILHRRDGEHGARRSRCGNRRLKM